VGAVKVEGEVRNYFFFPIFNRTTDFQKVKYVYVFDSIRARSRKSLPCIVAHFEITILKAAPSAVFGG
jgi:hypothetical protein